MLPFCLLLLIGCLLQYPVLATPLTSIASCTHLPDDEDWPSLADWAELNRTLSGRLIATVPQARVCHAAPYHVYDEFACQELAQEWSLAKTFLPQPAGSMNPYYQNQSCDPYTAISRPCQLGNYAAYSINVTGADDVVLGIRFAKAHNIRLVIKTTGHDYLGRSSGAGALSLWMWNLKTAEFNPDYQSSWYSGEALKLGAGITAGEAYEVADATGHRVVGGECGSVGLVGGYSQGGGHSLLSSAYGMGADQILEWDVITADGRHLIATPEQNQDLYWALSGGGAGNYAVVLGATIRAYSDGPVAGGTLSFANSNDTTFWQAVSLWVEQTPALVSDNNTFLFIVDNAGFEVITMTLPDQKAPAVQALLSPFLDSLDELGIVYKLTTSDSDSYLDHFSTYFGPLPYGQEPATTTLMSRLIPKSTAFNATTTASFVDAVRYIVDDGAFLVGCLVLNASGKSHPDNSVAPAWREAITGCNINAFWDFSAPLETNLAVKQKMVDTYVPAFEIATPGGGVYMNEMDPWYKGNWKNELYGDVYDRLASIKQAYDPSHLFWGGFNVGGDSLYLDEDGRLCQRSAPSE